MIGRRTAPVEMPAPSSVAGTSLLRLLEVANLLAVNLRTVQGWRASGRLRVLVLGPRCVRVELAEVERLIREARS